MRALLSGFLGWSIGMMAWRLFKNRREKILSAWVTRKTYQGGQYGRGAAGGFLGIFRMKAREESFMRDLPDFLEIFAMTVSVCVGFEAALHTALQLLPLGPLREDLEVMEQKMNLGQVREAAIDDLIRSKRHPALLTVLKVIKQAVQHGSPLENILRSQASRLREDRLLDLEKEAQTAGLKLLIPIMVFIFPTIFLLLFGGIWLSAQNSGSPFF